MKYIISMLILFSSYIAQAQDLVTGKLVNRADGLAVEGATLSVANQLFHSNEKGIFELKLKPGNFRIKITAIGFITLDTLINSHLNLLIALQPKVNQLDEVTINTGYQKVSAERLTSAYQQIDATALKEQVGSNIINRLEAIGNGLSVDRESYTRNRINIRGVATFAGQANPLIVLDYFPYEGSIDNINPNDIESITILKDAAASSIWGTRAGNGVIVIETKKGKYNQSLKFTANAVNTIKQAPDLYRLKPISSSDYIDVELIQFKAGKYLSDYNSPSKPVLSPVIELMYDASTTQAQKDVLIAKMRSHDVRDDFTKYFYSNGYAQQYYTQASAGGKGYGWIASAGLDQTRSELDALNKRMNLRYALNLDVLPQLKLNLSVGYASNKSLSGKNGYGSVTSTTTLYPYADFADDQGNPLPIPKAYSLSYIKSLSQVRLLDWKYYPLNDDSFQKTTVKSGDLDINTGLNYKWNGFQASLLYRYEKQDSNSELLQEMGSFYTRNLINSFTQINTAGTPTYKIPLGSISDHSIGVLTAHDLRAQINYNKRLGAHGLEVMAGGERRELINQGNSFRDYGYDPNNLTVTPVDYVNSFPNYVTGAGYYITNNQGRSLTNNRYISIYGNASYDYRQRYLLYGSARRDATNFFGTSTNNKWTPLWSAGLGWIVSKESFFHIDPVEFLKLRLTYGFSGNADPTRSGLTTIEYNGIAAYTQTPYANIDQKANPNLKWETVQTTNLGVDFKLFKGRISGNVDFYIKKGKDLLATYPVDATTGIGTFVLKNVGAMRGRGFDIQLNTINLESRLKWQSQFNISINNDEIVAYYYPFSSAGDLGSFTSTNIFGIIGRPVYSVFSLKSPGLDASGDPLGYLNGQLSKDYTAILTNTKIDQMKFEGSGLPTVFGNLQNRLSYGGFSLQVSISFKMGYYFRRTSIKYNDLTSGVGHSDFALRWQKPGDEAFTTVPAFVYPGNSSRDVFYTVSEQLIEKGDHIRFQYANLSYQLPKKLFKNSAYGVEIYLNASNLGILWRANNKGLDPEYYANTVVLPPAKTWSLGGRFNF